MLCSCPMKPLAICLLLCALPLGCSKSPPPAGKVVGIENICNEADGARVRVTGHVRYPRAILSFCSSFGGTKTCDLELHATAEKPPDVNLLRPRTGPEPVRVRLSVPVGTNPGEMKELPKKFTEADVVLHLPDKATATDGTRVTVDGTLSVIPQDPTADAGAAKRCYVKVEWARPG